MHIDNLILPPPRNPPKKGINSIKKNQKLSKTKPIKCFLIVCCIFQKKKKTLRFSLVSLNPFFCSIFLRFPLSSLFCVCFSYFSFYLSIWFLLCPFYHNFLLFSLYISLKTVVISMLRQSTWRIDHLLHATLLVFFCLPAWSPVRIALPTCTCACVAIIYWIVLEFCFHHPHT